MTNKVTAAGRETALIVKKSLGLVDLALKMNY
jgi:hypothetical protein